MKRIILGIAAMVCLIGQTDAQLRFGIKAGLDVDKFKNVAGEHKDHLGWQVGPMAQLMVPIIGIGVQPEALITKKKVDIAHRPHDMWDLQVPINLRYEFSLVPVLRPYVVAGPYFGWAIDRSGPEQKKFERTDWGLGIGGGVDFWKIHTGIRYSWGMKKPESGHIDVSPRTFTVSVGYLFKN